MFFCVREEIFDEEFCVSSNSFCWVMFQSLPPPLMTYAWDCGLQLLTNCPVLCLMKREKYMHQRILYPGSLKFETYLKIHKPQCYFSRAYSMSVASKFACVVFTCHEYFLEILP